MILFFKSLPRLIRSANRDAGRHFSMTFSSALSIGIALLIAMLMIVVTSNLNAFAGSIESEFVVQVSVQPALDEAASAALGDQLTALPGVDGITFSTKDQELDELIAENGEIFAQYKDSNPLFDTYTLQLSNAEEVASVSALAEELPGVAEVSYGGNIVTKMTGLFSAVRIGGYILVALMIGLAVFLTRTSVKMAIHMRREEIAIMRQVGAYNWYIQTPFLIEGLLTGFWGALVPVLILDLGYPALYNMLGGTFLSAMFPLVSPWPFCLWVSLLLLAIGLAAGGFGSLIAVRKNLKWIR